MARLKLQSQLVVSTLLIICSLTGAILLIIRHTVSLQIEGQVKDSTEAYVREFESIQRQLQVQLSRTAGLLSEIPTLKALMTTNDAPTIQDGSAPFWKLAGSDLFLLTDPAGRVVSLDARQVGLTREISEKYVKTSLEEEQDSMWWYAGDRLYWVFLRPILAGAGPDAKTLGFVAVGYETNSQIIDQLGFVTDSKILLLAGNRIVASTFSPQDEMRLQQRILANEMTPGANTSEVILGQDAYRVEKVALEPSPPAPVQCFVFVSLSRPMAFIRKLNRTILIVGLTAILLASLVLRFVSQTITHPLDNLVAGVRALAAGDYSYSITPSGSSEAVELAESFSRMRSELLASQRKQIETERVAAVGRAANSISHDLRHYMAALVANAEFLYEAENLHLNRDEVYKEIQTASEQMTELLDSLRDLAREQRNLSPVPAHMDECARRAIEAVRGRPEFRQQVISVRQTGDMAGVFDPQKMERAFLNLALNACEAVENRQGKIAFDIRSTQDAFEIRISDNGPGIPSSIRHNLFDPFVSAGKTNGTGLGLAIVSKILVDHGGSISVEVTTDDGTTFLARLPRTQRSVQNIAEKVTT
ncbi:MAG TPA: HAMP domain-containing sensor histidine kinase [Candidatus Saccharimonadales bacterium]|jgi:signal transduction histidine kinase|nr:HAMP domain-containing sensor histidine kinase [Candidatus Saccharimonadales bacterium]